MPQMNSNTQQQSSKSSTEAGAQRLAGAAQETIETVREKGREAASYAEKKVEDFKSSAGKQAENLRHAGERGAEQLQSRVRENPINSLLIAGGIGFVCGLLLRR